MTNPVLTCSRLNRQVIGIAGAIILIAFALSIVLDSVAALLVMPAVGLGLFIGGITGWCMLKFILARMPWNR